MRLRHAVCFATLAAAVLWPPLPAAGQAPRLRLDPGGHMAMVDSLAFSPRGRELFTASRDKTVQVWDAATGRRMRVLRGQIGDGREGQIEAMDMAPSGWTVAAAGHLTSSRSGLKVVRLLHPLTGNVQALLHGHNETIRSLRFSRDGRQLASASTDGTVCIWQMTRNAIASGRPFKALRVPNVAPSGIA